MRHGSLFSGIGGFDLAAEWMGWENVFHCEWKDFNQKILKYYWPNAITYTDITKTDFTPHRGTIDILTGGFPCQPYSLSGKRKGKEDDRHLWPEMLRAIREIQPTWIMGENVRGLINWNRGLVFEEVQSEMEAEGYEVQPFLLPAACVGAPHERYRVWFIAYSAGFDGRCNGSNWKDKVFANGGGDAPNPNSERLQVGVRSRGQSIQREARTFPRGESSRAFAKGNWNKFPTVAPVCNGNDGISFRLDIKTFPGWRSKSIEAAGNAIVPQVALQIFKAIESYNQL